MKNESRFLSIIVITFLFTACTGFGSKKEEQLSLGKDFKTVAINNKYQMSVPNYMKETTILNDEASLQYHNLFKEAYTIVIDEDKELFVTSMQEAEVYEDSMSVVENYGNIQMQFLNEGMNILAQGEPENLTVNGLNAQQIGFDGKVDDLNYKISYLLTFVEGENDLYMIMSWTLADSAKKYKTTYQQMAQSFREL